MLNIKFYINPNGLVYFKNKLNKKTNISIINNDAQILKNHIEKIFFKNNENLNLILSKLFGKINLVIDIEVFPKYFYLGAINVEKGLIVIGQPSHTSNFYMGLIGHELTHFLLSKLKLNRIVEEVICFMMEKEIISVLDNVELDDFLFFKNVDNFHLKAMDYALKHYLYFKTFYNNGDLNGLINFVSDIVNSTDKNINIDKNLITYLQNNA